MPVYCPDVAGTVSGCFRFCRPDVPEYAIVGLNDVMIIFITLKKYFLPRFSIYKEHYFIKRHTDRVVHFPSIMIFFAPIGWAPDFFNNVPICFAESFSI